MIKAYRGELPCLGQDVFIEESAQVVGRVELGDQSSVWFNAVIRGDVNQIRIGARTNIQDGTVVHVTRHHATQIGDDVTIGHNVTIHGCAIGNGCLIGMGAVILDGVGIGDGCIIAAGAVVSPGTQLAPGTLAIGAPARPRRLLDEKERDAIRQSALNYIDYARDYMTP